MYVIPNHLFDECCVIFRGLTKGGFCELSNGYSLELNTYFGRDQADLQRKSARNQVQKVQSLGHRLKKTWKQYRKSLPQPKYPYVCLPEWYFSVDIILCQPKLRTSDRISTNWFWSSSSSFRWNLSASRERCSVRDSVGITETSICFTADRLKTTWVGNLVQRPESLGNGRPVRPSKTELLPLDWSPTTTSYLNV